jgi:hypothetical protein
LFSVRVDASPTVFPAGASEREIAYNDALVSFVEQLLAQQAQQAQQARPDRYPEFHFLLLAPNLGAEWLFDAARVYWDRYRPTIIPDFEFLRLIPADYTVIVTVITRRDTVSTLGVRLAQANPNAYYDAVTYDEFDDMKKVLSDRATIGAPFGVAMTQPTPTLDPNAPIIPTPRLFPTNPPGGFVTQVPPATAAPSPTPIPPTFTPDAHGEGSDPVPISPTPGAVIPGG